jgi:hypothetical protein
MAILPELKKNISAFLTKEDGKITKESLIKAGIVLGVIAIGIKKVEASCYASDNGYRTCETCCGKGGDVTVATNWNGNILPVSGVWDRNQHGNCAGSAQGVRLTTNDPWQLHNNIPTPVTYASSTLSATHTHCCQSCHTNTPVNPNGGSNCGVGALISICTTIWLL